MLELFVVVSNSDNPESDESSVTDNLKAFFSPVSEFTIRENVPSPLSVTVAFTPSTAERDSANPLRVLLALETVTVWEVLVEFKMKESFDQLPKSIAMLPKLIASVLLEKPLNSNV